MRGISIEFGGRMADKWTHTEEVFGNLLIVSFYDNRDVDANSRHDLEGTYEAEQTVRLIGVGWRFNYGYNSDHARGCMAILDPDTTVETDPERGAKALWQYCNSKETAKSKYDAGVDWLPRDAQIVLRKGEGLKVYSWVRNLNDTYAIEVSRVLRLIFRIGG